MKKLEIAFLEDLKALLEKHNAVLCVETEQYGYEQSFKLTFDIGNHSFGNVIDDHGGFDIDPKQIDWVIDKYKKK
jgi:hypothetical protein